MFRFSSQSDTYLIHLGLSNPGIIPSTATLIARTVSAVGKTSPEYIVRCRAQPSLLSLPESDPTARPLMAATVQELRRSWNSSSSSPSLSSRVRARLKRKAAILTRASLTDLSK